MYTLFNGDCLIEMQKIADQSVDLVLVDLPYGCTRCKWDAIIPFDKLWEQFKRIGHDRTAFVFTATQPFTSMLVMSNQKMFKHAWVWDKQFGIGFQSAKYRPMQQHEDVLVFCKTSRYYPIMVPMDEPKEVYISKERNIQKRNNVVCPLSTRKEITDFRKVYTHRYPTSILKFKRDSKRYHPTQKPIALLDYLIRTYSQEGDTVLDCCMGSGSTGVAAEQLNRNFIGIEMNPEYFAIAQERIKAVKGNQVFTDVTS